MQNNSEFQWTDELVKEYAEFYKTKINKVGHLPYFVKDQWQNEFKQSKLPVPDYEILIFRGAGKKYLHEDIWDLYNGKYKLRGYNLREGIWDSKDMLKGLNSVEDGQLEIHSVKRISDGEVFTLGDKFNYDFVTSTIKQFEINPAHGMSLYSTDGCGYFKFNSIKKVKPNIPLFTTEDGVDVYDSQDYYILNSDFSFGGCVNGLGWYNPCSGQKYFSTKEAAKQYVLMNKPVEVSLSEIISLASGYNGCPEVEKRWIFKEHIIAFFKLKIKT